MHWKQCGPLGCLPALRPPQLLQDRQGGSHCTKVSIYLSIYLCVHISVFQPYAHLSSCRTAKGALIVPRYLSIYLSIYVYTYLSSSPTPTSALAGPSRGLSLYQGIYLSINLSIYLSISTYIYLSRCMSMSVSDTARLTSTVNSAEKSLSQILLTTCVGSKVSMHIYLLQSVHLLSAIEMN